MHLIVGLGNPGTEYDGTRHNVGFAAVDALAQKLDCGTFEHTKRAFAYTTSCLANRTKVLLAKPDTYMNESGRAVAALLRNHDVDSTGIIVISDDLDLPVGAHRVREEGSSGGHKGLQSIIEHLKTPAFTRVRIGIGPNETSDGHRIPAEQFVLQRFTKEEQPKIHAVIVAVVDEMTRRFAQK